MWGARLEVRREDEAEANLRSVGKSVFLERVESFLGRLAARYFPASRRERAPVVDAAPFVLRRITRVAIESFTCKKL